MSLSCESLVGNGGSFAEGIVRTSVMKVKTLSVGHNLDMANGNVDFHQVLLSKVLYED